MHSSLAEVNHKVDILQEAMNEIRGNFVLEDNNISRLKPSRHYSNQSNASTGSGHFIVSHIDPRGPPTNLPSSPPVSPPPSLPARQSQPYSHTGPYRNQSDLYTEPVVNGPSNGLHTPTNSPAEEMFASSTDTNIANHQDGKVTTGSNSSTEFIKVDGVRFAEEPKTEDKPKTDSMSAGQDTAEHGKFAYQSSQFEFKHATPLTGSPKTNIETDETTPKYVTKTDIDKDHTKKLDQKQEDAIQGRDTAQSQNQGLDKNELYPQAQEQDRHSPATTESTRRRCPTVNFGSSPLPTRSQSPPPKEYTGNWSYSNLKRKLTDKSEDNRSKYFVTGKGHRIT